jgi:hypothetical protein
MDKKLRENLIMRLIERWAKAIPGDSVVDVGRRYHPVLNQMTEDELMHVREKVVASTDAQLYLADEKAYRLMTERRSIPLPGEEFCELLDNILVGS